MWQLVVWIALTVISYLMTPKGTAQSSVTPGEVEATTVDSSGPVPVLFGTRLITTTNCVWYGDVGTTPIVTCNKGKK
jgi:uncharacterized membrane protein